LNKSPQQMAFLTKFSPPTPRKPLRLFSHYFLASQFSPPPIRITLF
jgi:hypothetical protein